MPAQGKIFAIRKKNGIKPESSLSRREVLGLALAAAGTGFAPSAFAASQPSGSTFPIPLKIGHRAASMKMVGDFDVFKVSRQIPGIMGVELQTAAGTPNLRDRDAVRRYKQEASRWGMHVPSLSGVWDRGVSIGSPAAGINLLDSIRAAEMLGANVILVAFFKADAPDMNHESSYGPIVELLQGIAPYARDAGVTIGLEDSLSPSDKKKLVDLVADPHVRIYYDVDGVAHHGHQTEAVPGIRLLGKERICQVHVRNQFNLIEEPGLIDWKKAFHELNQIGYDGWYVFESKHTSREQMIESTKQNVRFLQQLCKMPTA